MKVHPLLIVLIGLGLAASRPTVAVAQEQLPSPCRFTVSGAAATRPTIVGPEEVTSRAVVVDQPGSPVEIVAADLTGTDFQVSRGTYSMKTAWQVTVRNRSDQPVTGLAVALLISPVGTRESPNWPNLQGSGNKMGWSGVVMPGDTATVVTKGGGGNGSVSDATDMRLLVSVDRVEFKDCSYQPAKAIAK